MRGIFPVREAPPPSSHPHPTPPPPPTPEMLRRQLYLYWFYADSNLWKYSVASRGHIIQLKKKTKVILNSAIKTSEFLFISAMNERILFQTLYYTCIEAPKFLYHWPPVQEFIQTINLKKLTWDAIHT